MNPQQPPAASYAAAVQQQPQQQQMSLEDQWRWYYYQQQQQQQQQQQPQQPYVQQAQYQQYQPQQYSQYGQPGYGGAWQSAWSQQPQQQQPASAAVLGAQATQISSWSSQYSAAPPVQHQPHPQHHAPPPPHQQPQPYSHQYSQPQVQQQPQPNRPAEPYQQPAAPSDMGYNAVPPPSYNAVPPPGYNSQSNNQKAWASANKRQQQSTAPQVPQPQHYNVKSSTAATVQAAAIKAASSFTLKANQPMFGGSMQSHRPLKPVAPAPIPATVPPGQTSDPAGHGNRSNKWPESLRAFVERQFALCKDEASRASIQVRLKQLIQDVHQSGQLWTRNWDTEPSLHDESNENQARDPSTDNKRGNANSKKKRKGAAREAAKAKKQAARSNRSAIAASFASASQMYPRLVESHQKFSEMNFDKVTIRGTCQKLEKRYLRLTSAPDPSTVRPESVLKQALAWLLEKHSSEENYHYTCDQLKAIRQDLYVQHIQNSFTVKVYEEHARLAIKHGDMVEVNQCQTQLVELYKLDLGGNQEEFMAYRLLYVIEREALQTTKESGIDTLRLLLEMAETGSSTRRHPCVQHALRVREALALNNFVRFCKLYVRAPCYSGYLMQHALEKVRFEGIKCLVRTHRPSLAIESTARFLGFMTEDSSGDTKDEAIEECVSWLLAHGACLDQGPEGQYTMFNTKESTDTLFVPEKEDAVAHGDATMSLGSFLKGAKTAET